MALPKRAKTTWTWIQQFCGEYRFPLHVKNWCWIKYTFSVAAAAAAKERSALKWRWLAKSRGPSSPTLTVQTPGRDYHFFSNNHRMLLLLNLITFQCQLTIIAGNYFKRLLSTRKLPEICAPHYSPSKHLHYSSVSWLEENDPASSCQITFSEHWLVSTTFGAI